MGGINLYQYVVILIEVINPLGLAIKQQIPYGEKLSQSAIDQRV